MASRVPSPGFVRKRDKWRESEDFQNPSVYRLSSVTKNPAELSARAEMLA
jgi:hypothetical protein